MEIRLTGSSRTPGAFDEGASADLHTRQYELLFEMTTQLLAAQEVEERLLLTLDTATSGFGYPHAAIALIDKRSANLRMRMAVGFPDDAAVGTLEIPLDSNAPHVRV